MEHPKKLVGLVMFWLIGSSLYAHGPKLEIDKTAAAPGEVITVKGEGISRNGAIELTLQGIFQDYSLVETQGDEHGRFEERITLPADIQPGNYTLIAAGEGKATAKLQIQRVQETGSSHKMAEREGHEEHGQHEGTETSEEPHARAHAMEIHRLNNTLGTTLAWAIVFGSALIGLALLVSGRK
ncbi:MAG: hypothetical protein ACE5MK_01750 [Acidobacteriota bacterium]